MAETSERLSKPRHCPDLRSELSAAPVQVVVFIHMVLSLWNYSWKVTVITEYNKNNRSLIEKNLILENKQKILSSPFKIDLDCSKD